MRLLVESKRPPVGHVLLWLVWLATFVSLVAEGQ